MLHRNRYRIRPRSEFRAVDSQFIAAVAVCVVDHQITGDFASLLLWHEAQLLAVDRKKGLDVVEHRIALGLLGEAHLLVPTLGHVIGLALGGDIVGLDQILRQRDHLQRLGKGFDRSNRQSPLLGLAPDLEETRLGIEFDIAQIAQREFHRRLLLFENLVADPPGLLVDQLDQRLVHERLLSSMPLRLFASSLVLRSLSPVISCSAPAIWPIYCAI